MDGWIKLYRKISDNKLWTCEKFTRGQAWIDLLLLANHSYGYFFVRDHKIEVQRGEVGWSENKLAVRWKWSRSKLRNFLKQLEKEQQVKQRKSHSYSIIEIINYEIYQEKEQQDVQQKDNRKTTERQQKNTNKKNKEEIKNEKNIIPPAKNLVIEYCQQRKNNVDVNRWYNFYESKGWMIGKNKMKDWQAAIRTWEDEKDDEFNKAIREARHG